jgi:hypothetical protein
MVIAEDRGGAAPKWGVFTREPKFGLVPQPVRRSAMGWPVAQLGEEGRRPGAQRVVERYAECRVRAYLLTEPQDASRKEGREKLGAARGVEVGVLQNHVRDRGSSGQVSWIGEKSG